MDEKMKSEIKVITAGIVLVFSIVALFAINGALAWFAHNDTVEAEGMAVDVKTTPNLIIGKTEDELKGSKVYGKNILPTFNSTSETAKRTQVPLKQWKTWVLLCDQKNLSGYNKASS